VAGPADAPTLLSRARAQMKARLPGLAIESYRQALAIQPSPEASEELAEVLLRESHPQEALSVLESVRMASTHSCRSSLLMARALTESFRFEEAARHWRVAEGCCPDRAQFLQVQASCEAAVGRFDVARQLMSEAIDRKLDVAGSFYLLTTLKKMTVEDLPLVQSMRALSSTASLPHESLAKLNYGLGKTFDDLREFELAIGFFNEANRISYSASPRRRAYKPEETRVFVDFLIEYFKAERLRQLSPLGLGSELPLFVVGMLRSGTTLTENILGSHSQIRAGGEQMFWTQRAIEFFQWTPRGLVCNFPAAMRLGPSYLQMIETKEQRVRYVVDKNPTNIHLVPLLHCIFPKAKFVHLIRHPVDNLLSFWMTPFNADLSYVSHKGNLVDYYRNYLRLVDHLKDVMPAERFATFGYEDLTTHPEVAIPSMLGHLGLSLETACLEPEKSRRAVLTPSVYQVREPIHRGSQNRWKNYEPWLGEFADLLGSEAAL